MKKYTVQKEVIAKSISEAIRKEKTGTIYSVYEMEPIEDETANKIGFNNK